MEGNEGWQEAYLGGFGSFDNTNWLCTSPSMNSVNFVAPNYRFVELLSFTVDFMAN